MHPIISYVGGRLCAIVNYEQSSPLTFFYEGFHYSSLHGYSFFPSQGSLYIAHKPSFHGGSRNHFFMTAWGVLLFEHAKFCLI